MEHVRAWVESAGLTLHPEKTQIVHLDEPGGFDFLGYHLERGYRWPRKSSLKKYKDAIRAITPRTHGHRLPAIIADVNRTTRGWFGYFQHSQWTTFGPLDQWLRMRLRSILRRRIKLRGRGRGTNHQRLLRQGRSLHDDGGLPSGASVCGSPLTGEPDAEDPHVRFGGRGDAPRPSYP